jgi:hypothetical protein
LFGSAVAGNIVALNTALAHDKIIRCDPREIELITGETAWTCEKRADHIAITPNDKLVFVGKGIEVLSGFVIAQTPAVMESKGGLEQRGGIVKKEGFGVPECECAETQEANEECGLGMKTVGNERGQVIESESEKERQERKEDNAVTSVQEHSLS